METILIFCAHSDDEVIGMGGTIAKYSKEGKKVVVIIFSYGEKSSPWLKEEVVIHDRTKEAEAIGSFIGSSKTIFLGLEDTKLYEEIKNKKVKNKIKEMIRMYNPNKVFTHSSWDPHIDHRPVNKVVVEVLDELDKERKISLFEFEVWDVLNKEQVGMYVDISKTFDRKVEAMRKFKSQKVFIYTLLIPVYIRAILFGLHNKCRFAERFYKAR